MSLDEISNEHLRTFNVSWDYLIGTELKLSSISLEKVINLIQCIERHSDRRVEEDPLRFLQKYELIRNEQLTHAAFLLFLAQESANSQQPTA